MGWRDWTGVGERRWKTAPNEQVQPSKTLWDLLQLLIVPVILVGVTFAWSASQTKSDNKREDRRIEADRVAAEQMRQDATLNNYIQQMSDLMLHEKLLSKPRDASSGASRSVARTLTLTTLRRLNEERKGAVVRFLAEASLIHKNFKTGSPVNLEDADLQGAYLVDAVLSGTDLKRTFLVGANLTDAYVAGAALMSANLADANLTDASFDSANLNKANLRDANLTRADLKRAGLEEAILAAANITGADLYEASLAGADLTDADLTDADLTYTHMESANLRGANLSDANLSDAHFEHVDYRIRSDLSGAKLRGANLARTDLGNANLAGADIRDARNLDLGRYITGLTPAWQKEFLNSQKSFLDSLSPAELAKFNLTPKKLAKLRREANGG